MDIYNYSVFAYSYSVSCVRRSPAAPNGTLESKNGVTVEGTFADGAIAGIAVGSVAVAGVGGFSVFWFVVKKKKFADLIAIFKKK